MTTILVYHSIGDILFCEPIYRYFWQHDGARPKVIIRDHLMWMQDYIDSAEFTRASLYGDKVHSLEHNDQFVNLRFANQIYRGYDPDDHHDYENMILDKYRLLGLGDSLWKTLDIKFYQERTDSLFKTLNLFILDTFLIVNRESGAGTIEINAPKRKHIVEQRSIPGFNVLDWAGIYRQADGIHTVSTCSFFIMQALKNQGWHEPDIFIYPRPNEDGLRGISQLEPDFNYTAQ